jgi:hypothetical protein
MFFNEGSHLRPHFHAEYGEYIASVDFDGVIIEGTLPTRQARLVIDWALTHQDELAQNWELARSGQPLQRIAPLA